MRRHTQLARRILTIAAKIQQVKDAASELGIQVQDLNEGIVLRLLLEAERVKVITNRQENKKAER